MNIDRAPKWTEKTRLAYRDDWQRFTDWCDRHGLCPLPASLETVEAWATAASTDHKPSYLLRHLTTIRLVHRLMYLRAPLMPSIPRITPAKPIVVPLRQVSIVTVPGSGGAIRLTQIDGKLPNLALMKLARHYRDQGRELRFTKHVDRDMLEPDYERVYGSAIFSFSASRVARFREQFPGAIVGGTHNTADNTTVEQHLGIDECEAYDYSIYPRFEASLGFTQRGCRLKCGFCVVPKKEGKPRSVNTIASIWRGDPYPKHIHLLDNDFFGQPRDQWEARISEIIGGEFKVCINQGINIRLIDAEVARALAHVPYYDDGFKTRRLYTAWDSLGDEGRFFRGVDMLEEAGIPPTHLMVYMLVGYDPRETWERVFYRFNRMTARGMKPFPMIYGERHRGLPLGGFNQRIGHRTLHEFQGWAVRRTFALVPFEHFNRDHRAPSRHQLEMFA